MNAEDFRKQRVGIMTWHYGLNVGSFLQALALQTIIRRSGFPVLIIDYQARMKYSFWKGILRICLKQFYCLLPKSVQIRYGMHYYRLRKKYMAIKPFYDFNKIESMNKYFDIFVCGSDQVWAPSCLDDAYLLTFTAPEKKRIAYAPSLGLLSIPEHQKPLYRKALATFDALSIRERKGAEILKQDFGLNVPVVLDPTLLFTADEWLKMMKLPGKRNENVIFCYLLGKNLWHAEYVRKIADREGKKLVISSPHTIFSGYADEFCAYMTPDLFLGLIRDAEKVFTDSFHGMAFSVNFKKDFYFFYRFADDDPINQNSRVDNLAEMLGLYGRLIPSAETPLPQQTLDMEQIHSALSAERKQSIAYLEGALRS